MATKAMCADCKRVLGSFMEEEAFDEDETPEHIGVLSLGPPLLLTTGGASPVRPKRVLCATCYRKFKQSEDALEEEDEVSLRERATTAVDEFMVKPSVKRSIEKATGKALKDVMEILEKDELDEVDDVVDDIMKDTRAGPRLVITSETDEAEDDEEVRW